MAGQCHWIVCRELLTGRVDVARSLSGSHGVVSVTIAKCRGRASLNPFVEGSKRTVRRIPTYVIYACVFELCSAQ